MGAKLWAPAMSHGDVWGALERGKAAHLRIADGGPASNVPVLHDRTRMVMSIQAGRVVKDTLSGAAART